MMTKLDKISKNLPNKCAVFRDRKFVVFLESVAIFFLLKSKVFGNFVCSLEMTLTVRFGAVFGYCKSYSAVQCCDISYGAVRCGFHNS